MVCVAVSLVSLMLCISLLQGISVAHLFSVPLCQGREREKGEWGWRERERECVCVCVCVFIYMSVCECVSQCFNLVYILHVLSLKIVQRVIQKQCFFLLFVETVLSYMNLDMS